MKLVHLYLIAVFLMIAFLVASTMWQFGQFQSNIKNLQFGLPQELAQNMPDANQQLNQLMNQMQTQMQKPGASVPVENTAATAIETKIWIAPDKSFSFEYPGDWTIVNIGDQNMGSGGEILFSAYKAGVQSPLPAINSMTVEKSNIQNSQEVMERIDADLRATNAAAKITRYDIIKGDQTIPVIETEYSLTEPMSRIAITLKAVNAVIDCGEGIIYTLSVTLQNPDLATNQEIDGIIKSARLLK